MSKSHTPWWAWVTSLMLSAIIYGVTLQWLVMTWMGSPYYSHGFAVPLISIVLAYLRLRGLEEPPVIWAPWAGGGLITASLVTHLLAITRHQMLLSALSLIPLLCGIILILRGPRALQRLAFPLAFLLCAMPLPWLEQCTPWLAYHVARTAGQVAAALGIEVVIEGARISMADSALVVGAPCSGINSLAALVTLAALYAYVLRGPLWARLLLVVLAIPAALLANWLRVLILILLAHTWGVQAAMTYFHDWSSLVLFALALGLLIAASKVLRCQLAFDTLY